MTSVLYRSKEENQRYEKRIQKLKDDIDQLKQQNTELSSMEMLVKDRNKELEQLNKT